MGFDLSRRRAVAAGLSGLALTILGASMLLAWQGGAGVDPGRGAVHRLADRGGMLDGGAGGARWWRS
ncbi:hypothetical protein ACR720_03005 [Sphingomonas parapaucimobilis]